MRHLLLHRSEALLAVCERALLFGFHISRDYGADRFVFVAVGVRNRREHLPVLARRRWHGGPANARSRSGGGEVLLVSNSEPQVTAAHEILDGNHLTST